MRRTPTSRDSQSAPIRDTEAHWRGQAAGRSEPVSFAPRSPERRAIPHNLESAAQRRPSQGLHSHRDLAALQLVEAAEAAVRLANASEGAATGAPRAFDLMDVLDDVLTEAAPKADALGVSLILGPRGGDPPMLVLGDSFRLTQILSKLICGALEARGITSLRLAHHGQRVDGRLVFDLGLRLQRWDAASAPIEADVESGAVGANEEFSLSLAPGLLTAAVGGSSEQATDLSIALHLRLPLAPTQSPITRTTPAPTFEETALRDLRVLLVEDMDLNRTMVGMLLSPYGCDLSEAANGLEAIAAVDAQDYDIILMDLQLPELDGFEAMRRIRARQDHRAATPILAVSGRAMAADIAQARAAGADGHLSKPYTTQDLVAAIVKCRRDAGAEH